MPKALTLQEITAVNEYMRDGNKTRAYIAAGYSEKTAAQGASRFFNSVKIKTEIERRTAGVLQNVDKAMEVNTKNIIGALAEMALTNHVMAKFLKVTEEGDLEYDFTGATEQELRTVQPMIAELKTERYAEGKGEKKRDIIKSTIKFVDRQGILKTLGSWRKLKMWSEQTEHTHLVFAEKMTRSELEEYAASGKIPERLQGQIGQGQLSAGEQVIDGK